jgi:serine protease Do
MELAIGEQPLSMTRSSGDSEGEELRSDGAFAGVEVRELTSDLARRFSLSRDKGGVLVVHLAEGSPAEDAGLRAGDVIVEINRKPIAGLKDYTKVTGGLSPKDSALALVLRSGRSIYLTIKP